MKFLMLIFFSVSVTAQEDQCRELNLAEKILEALPSKECPQISESIIGIVNEEYQKFYGALPVKKQTIKGFSLSGPAKELMYLNEMLGKNPPAKWAEVAAQCQTSQCALEKLFESKEAAMQVMNIREKSGYLMSVDQEINGNFKEQFWSASEIREIDAAISKMPSELKNLGKLKKFSRMADGLRLTSHSEQVAAYARPGTPLRSGQIVAYDIGMRGKTHGKNPYQTTSWPQEVIVHETCHHHDFQSYYKGSFRLQSEKKNSPWAALSGWKEVTNEKGETQWQKKADAKFISWYAETDPAEDFAESCMNYILHPEKLKQQTPEKYAWIKANLFKNKEFNDKPWSESMGWPEFQNLIADETGCKEKLAECSKNLKPYKWMSVQAQIQETKCFADFSNQKIQNINQTLMDSPQYCENGGSGAINAQSDKVCGNSLKSLSSLNEAAQKYDFTAAVNDCESKLDYSSECVFEASKLLKDVPKDILPVAKNFLSIQVPDRMSSLGNGLSNYKTSTWLKACLETVKEIDTFDSKNNKYLQISYTSKSNSQAEFLGKYIFKDYDRDGINKECAEAAIKSLVNQVKVPERGYAVNVMQAPFLNELRSFETEVIGKYKQATSGCVYKACKADRILKLIQVWEEKSPKREGFATKEYAEELVNKIN
jgi:Glucose-regulated metallo-peptidase M90